MNIKFALCIFMGMCLFGKAFGQSDTLLLTYKTYLEVALSSNESLKAKRYDVPMAEAKISQAKIGSDPYLSIGNAAYEMEGKHMPNQWYVTLTKNIDLGNKRKERVNLAHAELEVTKAEQYDFERRFKLEATEKFIDALIAQLIYEREWATYKEARDELLFKKNTGTPGVEMSRINIELGELRDHVYKAELQMRIAKLNLALPEGSDLNENKLKLAGNLLVPYKEYNIDSLIRAAELSRPDLQASRLEEKSLLQEKKLIQASRIIDVDLGVGENYFTQATNEIAPSPSYNAVLATASFPIKFSNRHKESLRIADMGLRQAESNTRMNELLVAIEIKQAYIKYNIAHREVQLYNDSMLEEATKTIVSEIRTYKEGTTSFMDLSETHRKLDEVYMEYYEALKTYAYSLVELEYAAGIWDIDFGK